MTGDAKHVAPAWRVRVAGPEDVEVILALVHAAYRGESSRTGWTTEADLLDGGRTDAGEVRDFIITPGSVILLADAGVALVGSVHLRQAGNGAHLGLFTVRPDLQGRGVGKRLLAQAESFTREQWQAQAIRMTVISRRTELIAFYERRGYVRTGEHQSFPDHPRYGIPRVEGLKLVVLEKRFTG